MHLLEHLLLPLPNLSALHVTIKELSVLDMEPVSMEHVTALMDLLVKIVLLPLELLFATITLNVMILTIVPMMFVLTLELTLHPAKTLKRTVTMETHVPLIAAILFLDVNIWIFLAPAMTTTHVLTKFAILMLDVL
jgi:hypothetical protein